MKELLDYLGIPYKLYGRDRGGLDCWGFVILVYREKLGKELLDVEKTYDEHWSWKGANYFIENYARQWQPVNAPALYDLVFFTNNRNVANHCGIYLDNGRFMHCCKAGVVVGKLTDAVWKNRIQGFYRLKND